MASRRFPILLSFEFKDEPVVLATVCDFPDPLGYDGCAASKMVFSPVYDLGHIQNPQKPLARGLVLLEGSCVIRNATEGLGDGSMALVSLSEDPGSFPAFTPWLTITYNPVPQFHRI